MLKLSSVLPEIAYIGSFLIYVYVYANIYIYTLYMNIPILTNQRAS